MPSRRAVLAVGVVGLLLLPGPVYATVAEEVTGPDRTRSPSGYTANPIDTTDDERLAERYGPELTVRLERLSEPVATKYDAPNATRRLVERAIENGTANTTDDRVASDLRRLDRVGGFVASETTTYRLGVAASDERTTLTARPANESVVAQAVREQLIVEFGSLSADERATFLKIRNATRDESRFDYRPYTDEPVPADRIVRHEGTAYAVERASVSDDANLLLPVVGFGLSALGAVCVVGAGVGLTVQRLRE